MPVTKIPSEYLSDTIKSMQRQLDELQRAVGRPTSIMRDSSDNVVHMPGGSGVPVMSAKGQGVSLVMTNGTVTVADEQGRGTAPLATSMLNGPVTGDTYGVHHGDVGISGVEFHNHYGDLHGNGFGFWYGPVGDGTTQNQINATNVFANGFFGNVGIPGQNWTLYGTVVAPSEARLKRDVRLRQDDAGELVDAVPSYQWYWKPEVFSDEDGDTDEHEHAGPLVDDLAEHAPWLVRQERDSDVRGYNDRDLIGVLWAALRDARARITELEKRMSP